MPLDRRYSFEQDDQTSAHHQQPPSQSFQSSSPPRTLHIQHRDLISPPPLYSSPPQHVQQTRPTSKGSSRTAQQPPSSPNRTYLPALDTSAGQRTQQHDPVSPVSPYRPSSSHSRARSPNGPSLDIPRRPVPAAVNHNYPTPVPPPHRTSPTRDAYRPQSIVTPGADNFSDQSQGGGLGRVAQNIADRYPRESGMEAMRGMPPHGYHPEQQQQQQRYDEYRPDQNQYLQRPPSRPYERASHGSNIPLAGSAAGPGASTPGSYSPSLHPSAHSGRDIPLHDYSPPRQQQYMGPYGHYQDSPYQSSSHNLHNAREHVDINPSNIVDDGDDGFIPEPKRRSFIPNGRDRSRESLGKPPVAAGGAAAVGAGAALGGVFGRPQKSVTSSGSYNPVAQDASNDPGHEKSEWLSRQTKGNSKMKWIVGVVIAIVVVLAIVGGVVGGILGSKKHVGSSGNINNAADDTAANGDLGANSPEIKSLMNNKNLHKVFPAMDYTPWGAQSPLCLTYPPSQNNVTRDMAVLSQLTNTVRLYGTDCNQTEMVLHAIDRLKLKDMKVWLGVWIDTNQTTTDRQLAQMYTILENVKDRSIFKGVIIGNEALYRAGESKAQSEAELIQILTDVRANFTNLSYDLPIATSDLGDNWNPNLVTAVDYVMANIHPFFAGQAVEDAAAWTWNFWQTHNVILTADNPNVKQVISETGWPSGGGTDCGNTENVCASGQTGAVASVENMNKFMEDWVCQSLDNGTDYFWFEAFDEPWKIQYNEAGKEWEDKWGLMYPDRKLKPGLKIPDCGGRTI